MSQIQRDKPNFPSVWLAVLSLFVLLVTNTLLYKYISWNEITVPSPASGPASNIVANELVLGDSIEFPIRYVASTVPLDFQMTIRNPLSEEVSFSEVKPSCTCIQADLGRMTLGAGESTTLNGSFRPLNTKIDVKRISVELKDSRDRKWTYRMSLKTYPVVRFEDPASLVQLGEVSPSGWERTVCVYTYRPKGSAPHKIDLRECPDHVGASITQVSESENSDGVIEQRFDLTVTGKPQDTGTGSAQFTVAADNGTLSQAAKLSAQWTVPGPFVLEPSELRFGTSSEQQTLWIRRTDGGSFRITSVHSEEEAVSLSVGDPVNSSKLQIDATCDVRSSKADSRVLQEANRTHR
jgi:hypothetical protein